MSIAEEEEEKEEEEEEGDCGDDAEVGAESNSSRIGPTS
jgi:hypothetical protein